ncbi:MAG: VWA domain-containing protein [Deltaproteobacteria bacterium]|nr:VWA domain-containing protein [Deltaproteobacteria bacterium]
MNKTAALFGLAGTLLVGAIVLDHWPTGGISRPHSPPTPPDRPPPPPPLRLSSSAPPTLRLGDLVRLDAALSQDRIAADAPGELYTRFDLEAADSRARPNVSLAIVLDRSGSMAGDKIEKTRRAAKGLVERLAPSDTISIVTYSTDVSLDVPLVMASPEQKARILRVIDQIYDGGGTNLSGGLERGLQTLEAGDPSSVRRLVLMSDGNANQGITDPRTLAQLSAQARQRGITISTLGVGVDFNEDLMTAVAEAAGGTYYYVKDAASMSDALARELRDLEALAARSVEVGLDFAPGVRLVELYGYRSELRGNRIVIPVGDMSSGQKRQVVVRLATPARSAGGLELMRVTLGYAPPLGGAVSEFSGALGVEASTNATEVASSERKDVTETVEEIQAAKARQDAANKFASGQRSEAERSLRQQLRTTRAKAAALGSAALDNQAVQLESALKGMSDFDSSSEAGKDLVKREKAAARSVYAY